MARSNADLLAIKAELTNNPLTLSGYLALDAANDEANANALNLVRVECQVDRETIPASEVNKAIDRDEFNALSAADRQWLAMITQGGSINPKTGSEVREGLLQLFGVGTESRTSLMALLTESSSRLNMLWKLGTLAQGGTATPSDIAQARAAV